MSLTLAVAIAATPALPTCSWDRPGHDPFMGDVVAAVDRYQDIPTETRRRLKRRMAARAYDEIVLIGRDAITGRAQYDSTIRDMHFGQGQVCATVTRARWQATMQERGLVYCEDGQCILVPTVCRNVSRIQRLAPATAAPAGGGGSGQAAAPAAAADPAAELVAALDFAPPGAGLGQVPGTRADEGSFAHGANLATPANTVASNLPLTGLANGPAPAGGQATDPRLTPGWTGTPDAFWVADLAPDGPGALPPPASSTANDLGGFAASGPASSSGLVTGLPPAGDLGALLPGAPGSVTPAVPEPSAGALMALGGLLLWGLRRRRPG